MGEAEAARLGGKDETSRRKPTGETAAKAEEEVERAISSRRQRRRWAESGEEDERDGGGEDRIWDDKMGGRGWTLLTSSFCPKIKYNPHGHGHGTDNPAMITRPKYPLLWDRIGSAIIG